VLRLLLLRLVRTCLAPIALHRSELLGEPASVLSKLRHGSAYSSAEHHLQWVAFRLHHWIRHHAEVAGELGRNHRFMYFESNASGRTGDFLDLRDLGHADHGFSGDELYGDGFECERIELSYDFNRGEFDSDLSGVSAV
jgi:hypothetical protein